MATKAYFQPPSLDEALCLVAEHPGSLVIAGGTLALPLINKGVSQPEKVIGLRRAGLSYVRRENGTVKMGATTTLTQVRSAAGIPLLVEAAANVGAWQVQNMGTAAGNLFAPPPAGDFAVALLALDTRVVIASYSRGRRVVPLSGFYTGFMTNCLEPDELVIELQTPVPQGKTVLLKHGRLFTNTPSIVAVAAHVLPDGGRVKDARIAMNAVGPHPMLAKNAQAAITGATLSETAVDAAGAAASAECDPFTDPIATEDYRRKMAGVFVKRALAQLAA